MPDNKEDKNSQSKWSDATGTGNQKQDRRIAMKGFQNRKTILVSILLAVLFLLCVGIWYFFLRVTPRFEESAKADMNKDIQIEQLENGRVVAITSNTPYFPDFMMGQKNLYLTEWRRNSTRGIPRDDKQNEGEYYYLHSYDLNSKKEEKKLDLYAIIRKYDSKAGIRLSELGEIVYYQGADYLHIILSKEKKGAPTSYKDVLINTETEEVIDYPKDIFDQKGEFTSAISTTGLSKLVLDKYNIHIINTGLEPVVEGEMNIESNLNISQSNPNLVEKLNRGKTRIFVRQGENSQEEWFNILMRWFALIGEEKLSLTITDETTGEVTPINSYQDYLAWLESHPKESEVIGSQ